MGTKRERKSEFITTTTVKVNGTLKRGGNRGGMSQKRVKEIDDFI